MRFRTLALGITAVGLLAVGTAAPSPAAEVKKFEGTIAAPAPVVSNELAKMEDFCPTGGDANGSVYRFFDLGADYTHFYVSGPALNVNEADPTGVYGGSFQDYDLDFYGFNAKCSTVDGDGPINDQMGVGSYTSSRPIRYVAINYFAGPYPEIPIVLEASTEKIKK